MSQRKENRAKAMKEARRSQYFAKLNDVPTSPRKMRLVADMIRGMEAYKALSIYRPSLSCIPHLFTGICRLPHGTQPQNVCSPYRSRHRHFL